MFGTHPNRTLCKSSSICGPCKHRNELQLPAMAIIADRIVHANREPTVRFSCKLLPKRPARKVFHLLLTYSKIAKILGPRKFAISDRLKSPFLPPDPSCYQRGSNNTSQENTIWRDWIEARARDKSEPRSKNFAAGGPLFFNSILFRISCSIYSAGLWPLCRQRCSWPLLCRVRVAHNDTGCSTSDVSRVTSAHVHPAQRLLKSYARGVRFRVQLRLVGIQ